jgi:hypothetical protein
MVSFGKSTRKVQFRVDHTIFDPCSDSSSDEGEQVDRLYAQINQLMVEVENS